MANIRFKNFGGYRGDESQDSGRSTRFYRDENPDPVIPFVDPSSINPNGNPNLQYQQLNNPAFQAGHITSTDSLLLTRPFQTLTINVGTVPTLVVKPPHSSLYLFSNPAMSVGLTSAFEVASGTVDVAGNSQLTPIGVANYLNAHYFLNVTAVTGTWDFIAQALDPSSNTWADTQTIFAGIDAAAFAATPTMYAYIGALGLATDFAIRWNPTAAGEITFSLSMVVKDGTVGGSTGFARSIFLGGPSVTVDSGYPLFEGKERSLRIVGDVELYAVSYVTTRLKVFLM